MYTGMVKMVFAKVGSRRSQNRDGMAAKKIVYIVA